ncbi:MAG: WYL domain-containing protein [Taibaiella sp.]|nr:WYL domain-containing protein [Taibaiella sp.]
MPRNKDFTRRIEILDECLRRRQRKWFIEDLLQAVNDKLDDRFDKKVSKRSLYDDLKYLQEEKGAPVKKCWEGQRVYYQYEDATYSVLNLPISEEEIVKLKDAVKMLREVNDFNLLDDVDTIVNKLEHTIATNVPENRSMIQFEKHTYADGAEYIDDIFSAIKEKSVLKIIYQPFGAPEPQEWVVHPYLLKEYRNRWFLICRRDGSQKVTNLALDRIKKIKNSSLAFVENDLFDADTYYTSLIGVTFPEGELVQDIILKVTGRQVNYVKTKPIHKSQEIVEEPTKETLIIRLKLINNYELQAVLLSYTPDIEVLQPIELRNQLKEKYAAMMNVLK